MGRVHLTFDNGPHPEVTDRVLRSLEARALNASFFVLGKHLVTDWGRALVEREVAEGHRVANHSWSHETPLGQDPRPDAVALEMQRTQELVDEVWSGPRWFRPFGGGGKLGPHLLSPKAARWLQDEGMTCVLWNSVPGDWIDADAWVQKALADVERQDVTVLVVHDIFPDAMAHLDGFLDTLLERGHTVTDALPPTLTPVREGVPSADLDTFVNRSPGGMHA